jgi:hypothetical protein
MKSYVMTTGALFSIMAVAHLLEVFDRRHLSISDVVLIGAAIGLALWAWRVSRALALKS